MEKRNAKHGVVYFNHGTKHLVRLVVSLVSLRRHYDGPVCILDSGEESAIGPLDSIAPHGGDDLTLRRIAIPHRRRNTAYTAKASLWRWSPFDMTLFLDADTVVAGDVSPLLDKAKQSESGFVVTRFSNWTTNAGLIPGRIEKWRNVKAVDIDVAALVQSALSRPSPAINTGVVAWRRDAAMLPLWERLTGAGWRCPFTDELAAQLLLERHKAAMVNDAFNCSPIYGANKASAVVWHCHGHKELRSEAAPLWLPIFTECLTRSVARVRDWMPADDRLRYAEYLR